MHQLCWKMVPIVAEWSSFLQDTSSLLFCVLKGLFEFEHLDGNQYNRGWEKHWRSRCAHHEGWAQELVISAPTQGQNPFGFGSTSG